MRKPFALGVLVCVCVCWIAAGVVFAGGNQCDEGEAPDVIVGDLFDTNRYGTVGGITGYAIGTESCNIGTCWLNWISNNNNHPVIAQNMYRLNDGRFEQIGQSWLKHGFATLDDPLCFNDCIPGGGQHLGVHCSDPYWATLNGSQTSLGPRFEVNASTGEYPYPASMLNQTGNQIFKRMQVRNTDLDPALNVGASYYVEGQYVTKDDAAAGNHKNNISWRPVNVGNSPYNLTLTGETVRMQSALNAWKVADPTVSIVKFDQSNFDGGSKVTDLGGGMWRYEYAIHNATSDRSAQAFEVPVPHGATITNVGFHDIDYHSGEPFNGDDWAFEVKGGAVPNSIKWSTETYTENPNANALRWGTLYNFRFDADYPPGAGTSSTVWLFKPPAEGESNRVIWKTQLPSQCGDGFCEGTENCDVCPEDCEGDGGATCCGDDVCEGGEDACHCSADCGSGCPAGAVGAGGLGQLTVDKGAGGDIELAWGDSCSPLDSDYGIYEGIVGNFASHSSLQCGTGGQASATITPTVTNGYYLVVPSNGVREGDYGADSSGTSRPQGAGACFEQAFGECPD